MFKGYQLFFSFVLGFCLVLSSFLFNGGLTAEIMGRDFDAIKINGTRFKWDAKVNGKVITSLCQDLRGNVWVGTEDKGIWLLEVSTGKIKCVGRTREKNESLDRPLQVNEQLLLTDDIAYSLTCDKLGRIWAGHNYKGVSVFVNGSWNNYDVESGPLGERVFDIEVNPADGDVWIATSMGLARYQCSIESQITKMREKIVAEDQKAAKKPRTLKEALERTDESTEGKRIWEYYTRVNGMPSDQISCVAFSPKGDRIYVGTQCHGIVMADIPERGKAIKWQHIDGPVQMPLLPTGTGLPSGRINDLVVTSNGMVYAATDTGLAVSDKSGKKWKYYRGRDLLKKAEDLYIPLHVGDEGIAKKREKILKKRAELLKLKGSDFFFDEDYVTSVNVDDEGNLWIGQGVTGYSVFNPEKKSTVYTLKEDLDLFGQKDILATKIFFPISDSPLISFYGKGILQSSFLTKVSRKKFASKALSQQASPPLPAIPLKYTTLKDYRNRFFYVQAKSHAPTKVNKEKDANRFYTPSKVAKPEDNTRFYAEYIADDWQTKGNWLGRYGKQFAVLCGADSPKNHYVYQKDAAGRFLVYGMIGPHVKPQEDVQKRDVDDSIRLWLNALSTDDPRSLYNPIVGNRRQSEWDDHGEVYPITWEGPDLWIMVGVPRGFHRLEMYFVNPGGQDGRNFYRNYVVEVRARQDKVKNQKDLALSIKKACFTEPMVKTRVTSFYGGVYKKFLLKGPASYWVRIKSNYSYNCQVSAVMFSQMTNQGPIVLKHKGKIAGIEDLDYNPPSYKPSEFKTPSARGGDLAQREIFMGRGICEDTGNILRYVSLMNYRAVAAENDANATANYRWKLGLWKESDKKEFEALIEEHGSSVKNEVKVDKAKTK